MDTSWPTLPEHFSLRARWVFPVAAPPWRDGVVTVRDGKVVSLSTTNAAPKMIDLGESAILPGLINAHTHLEFSDLAAPLGHAGMPIADWIRQVIQYRRARLDGPAPSIGVGLQESIASGVALIGEIATEGWRPPDFPIALTAFLESIGLTPERGAARLEASQEFLTSPESGRLNRGLSPHAPYTVHPQLCEQLIELAQKHDAPVAMHLAESPEEMELLRSGRGGLVDLLAELGAWRADAIPLGARPLDYLQMLADAPRALVVHGNFLANDELDFLAAHRERMSLVYCPRTHHYFGHAPYHSLSDLLRRGVRVALGTDSRASNPDLSIFAELQFVAAQQREMHGAELLQLITTSAAAALGASAAHGAIAAGRTADLCIVRLGANSAHDPFERLWDHESHVAAAILGGKLAHCLPGFANHAS
jgi:cytosine/adenosine deaminase-related metal-dependent hydrolase